MGDVEGLRFLDLFVVGCVEVAGVGAYDEDAEAEEGDGFGGCYGGCCCCFGV